MLLFFGPIGIPEVILICALALLIFGPKKLPELGRSLGKGLREFKKGAAEMKESLSVNLDEPAPTAQRPNTNQALPPSQQASVIPQEPPPAAEPVKKTVIDLEGDGDQPK